MLKTTLLCATFYFRVGTSESLPGYTTAPFPCQWDAASSVEQLSDIAEPHDEMYAITRPVPPDFDASSARAEKRP